MLKEIVLVSLVLNIVRKSEAVIYTLNESEYNRMPPLYALDDYDACMLDPGAVFCVVHLDLVSRQPSPLYNLIKEYSAHTIKHYNHTQIHRGVCIQQRCAKYFNTTNTTTDLVSPLVACLNQTVWDEYQLEATIEELEYCVREGEELGVDGWDVLMALVYTVLIVANVVGSFYDIWFCDVNSKVGNPYLLSFSVRRNWRKLIAPAGVGPEPRLSRLKIFNGMRTMTMFCVIFSHTVLVMSYSFVENPRYIETAYEDPLKQILFNGSLVTFTFFVMSAFLLAYNFLIHSEKHGISWTQLPKGILMRWLRLTPVYALVLGTVCSWMRHLGEGPLWQDVVGGEADACRRYWWAHLLYINNYIYDDSQCAPQTWYLAADTQLFCIGLLVLVVARTPRSRKIALILLFVMSLIMPAAHTYLQDLEAVVIQSPESYRTLYSHDATFRLLYVCGHTNLSTYTLGLAGAFFVYNCQCNGTDMSQYKKYRYFAWLVFPLGVLTILSGGIFYQDGVEIPFLFKLLYAVLYKPVFQLLVLGLIIACVFRIETVYRGIMEWRGFTWTGRVSYSAFLLHTMYQRALIGSQRHPTFMSDYFIMHCLCSTIFLSFLSAAILWITVECPIAQLIKAILAPPPRQRHLEDNIVKEGVNNNGAVLGDGLTKL